MMDAAALRQHCLALPGVTEKTPFARFSSHYASVVGFYARGRMFCFTDMEDFTWVDVRVGEADREALLGSRASVGHPANPVLDRQWVRIALGGDVPWGQVLQLVDAAYGLVTEDKGSGKGTKKG